MRVGRVEPAGRIGPWAALLVASIVGALVPSASAAMQEGPALEAPFPENVAEIDRVVAIVGDTAILLSDVRNEMFRLEAQQGTTIPPEGTPQWTQVARQVVNALVDLTIWLQEAKRVGLSAPAAEVDRVSEEYFQQARQGFPSDEALAEVIEESGMNMLQYRQMLRANAETEVLLEIFRASLAQRDDLPPVVVNESEVEQFFSEQVGDQTRPPLVSFNQLIVTPYPDGAARDSAIALSLRAQLELNDEDFEVVARRWSADEGTREAGGELGWMRREDLVKEFADAAWQARAGNTIGPVQSRFGLHLIKVENIRGGERFIRHILIRPELDDDDHERARSFAAVLADSLEAGIDPERLQRANSEVARDQIRFDNIPIQQLTQRFRPEDIAEIATPVEGEVYGPFPIERGGPTEYAVVHILGYRPEGPMEVDDFRDQIRQNLRVTKQIDVILAEMRSRTFVDIKL